MVGQKELRGTQSKQEAEPRVRRLLSLTLTRGDRRLNPKLARVPPMPIHETHGVPSGGSITITLRFPLTLDMERTNTPGDNSIARQRSLAGDSLNDEQRGDDLIDPWLHEAIYSRSPSREGTNLNLGKDR